LLENASGVFATASEKQAATPDLKDLHAKIGQQALEIDFLAVALGRIGDAEVPTIYLSSAKSSPGHSPPGPYFINYPSAPTRRARSADWDTPLQMPPYSIHGASSCVS
jgi:hypothetical protein